MPGRPSRRIWCWPERSPGRKEISSKTAVSVSGGNGYMLKGIVKADGHAAIGAYLHGLLVNEIVIRTDGTFSFMKQGEELARVTGRRHILRYFAE